MVERKTAHFFSWYYGRYVVLGFAFHAWIESTYTSALATTIGGAQGDRKRCVTLLHSPPISKVLRLRPFYTKSETGAK